MQCSQHSISTRIGNPQPKGTLPFRFIEKYDVWGTQLLKDTHIQHSARYCWAFSLRLGSTYKLSTISVTTTICITTQQLLKKSYKFQTLRIEPWSADQATSAIQAEPPYTLRITLLAHVDSMTTQVVLPVHGQFQTLQLTSAASWKPAIGSNKIYSHTISTYIRPDVEFLCQYCQCDITANSQNTLVREESSFMEFSVSCKLKVYFPRNKCFSDN